MKREQQDRRETQRTRARIIRRLKRANKRHPHDPVISQVLLKLSRAVV